MSDLDIYLKGKPYTLTKDQYKYCDDVIYGDTHVSNWSVAGSGKSLCLEVIKGVMRDRCVICATTGIANSILFDNKGGQGTMHSVFSLPTELYNSYHEKKVGKTTQNLLGTSDLVTTIIIEEAGMVTPDQLSLILKRVARYNRPYGKKRKRRNIKLVLQGDLLQLGSVITKDDEIQYMREQYGSEQLFESTVFNEMSFSVHIFTKVLRTNDKVFQAALEVIRYGQEHRYEGVLRWLNKRCVPAPNDALMITTTNKQVDVLNKKALALNSNREYKLHATLSGDYNMKNCPADEVIVLKEGLPVITLTNCQEGNYFNGSYGHVSSVIVGEGVYVKFAATGEEHFVPYFEYEEKEYFTDHNEEGEAFMNSKSIGKCLQAPCKPASCFSVYRMQGKSVDSPMVIDLGWGFPESQNNPWGFAQAYVAISRATDINHVYFKQRLTKKHLKANMKAVEWVRGHMHLEK